MAQKRGKKIKITTLQVVRFLRKGIWRIDRSRLGTKKLKTYNLIKSFILASRSVISSELNTQAAALTYNTLLSIIPLLAVLLGIAQGFGIQNILKSQLFSYFSGQQTILIKAMTFVDQSLKYAKGGVFLGIGLVALLYTVMNLFAKIELSFNSIWNIKNTRSYYRQFTDYFALIIIIPLFIIFNSTLNILLNTSSQIQIIGSVIDPIIKIVPYVIMIGIFVFIFCYIPNTKVKFKSALFAGIFTGIVFQIFQQIYIGGQLWITQYNAIYGSFAALPLFLLWVQTSWFICLFGVELAFANQNINKFNFERESNTISHRYKDFLTLIITTLIVKRFEKGEKPYTADELSEEYKIPTRLTADILSLLEKIDILIETPSAENLIPAYIPAIDINKITINFLFEKMDIHGSEDFNVEIKNEFINVWETILDIRKYTHKTASTLVKDL